MIHTRFPDIVTLNYGTRKDFMGMNKSYVNEKIEKFSIDLIKEINDKTLSPQDQDVESKVFKKMEEVSCVVSHSYLSNLFPNEKPIMLLQEYYNQTNGLSFWLSEQEYIVYDPEQRKLLK
jgi:hypothetical protein